MLWYLVAGIVGFFIGVIASCVLLCKRSLEAYQKATDGLSNSVEAAKNVYHNAVAEYENGTAGLEAAEDEEETEEQAGE